MPVRESSPVEADAFDAADTRSPERRALDEYIAAEVESEAGEPPVRPAGVVPRPVEAWLPRPRAVSGVVENGVVRPVDPSVTLPEHARVLIVTAGG